MNHQYSKNFSICVIVVSGLFIGMSLLMPVSIFAGSNFQQTINPLTECNDGVDNDGDGGIDFATDTECTSWLDDSESVTTTTSSSSSTTTSASAGIGGQPPQAASQPQSIFELPAFVMNKFIVEPIAEVLGIRNEIDSGTLTNELFSTLRCAIAIYLIAVFAAILWIKRKNHERESDEKTNQ
ncbi:MAG: hypothetical protein JNK26_04375 [Candidatus Doudnabacteria bacterium]|nr:hypothetical protein [Candidatus Doudnabacteria bacterium]